MNKMGCDCRESSMAYHPSSVQCHRRIQPDYQKNNDILYLISFQAPYPPTGYDNGGFTTFQFATNTKSALNSMSYAQQTATWNSIPGKRQLKT